MVKNPPSNAGDVGSIPGSGWPPGGRNDNPLQYFCLENSMDREIWQTSVHGVTKSQTQGSDSAHTHIMEKGKKRHAKGKFGLGIRNEAGQRLIEFCKENALVIANTLLQQHKRRLYIWTPPDGQHWNQIEQDLEMTVAQIMNSLLPNSDLNLRKWGKPLDHSGMT